MRIILSNEVASFKDRVEIHNARVSPMELILNNLLLVPYSHEYKMELCIPG